MISTLVENVATAYFQLREYDLELEIAKRTLASRKQSLQLTQTLEQGGATGLNDVRQAQQLVEEAAELIPQAEQEIQQGENQISVLLGENPRQSAAASRLENSRSLSRCRLAFLPRSLNAGPTFRNRNKT